MFFGRTDTTRENNDHLFGSGMVGQQDKQNPYSPESVQASSLGRVPNPDGFVLAVGHDEVLARMENNARNVVVVTAASVDFPSLWLNSSYNK